VPFHDIFWYFGWIMVSTKTKCRHLLERVMRQYGHMQAILIPPTDVAPLEPEGEGPERILSFIRTDEGFSSHLKRG